MSDPPADVRAPQPCTIAVANQKGGVGKTTTAINVATALAESGERVLLVDLDPQGNASTGLGADHGSRAGGTYAMLTGGRAAASLIRPTETEGLWLIPADRDLAAAEIELVGEEAREHKLQSVLTPLRDARQRFTFVIIDCPPSLGLLTLNGLVAANAVLVPLQCEFFALEGITQLVRTIDAVRVRLNPALRLQGIVLTMYDRRNNLSDLVAADARAFFGNKVYETVIPRNVRVSEAPSHGKSVLTYDPRSSGALAYVKLAAELMQREHAALRSAA